MMEKSKLIPIVIGCVAIITLIFGMRESKKDETALWMQHNAKVTSYTVNTLENNKNIGLGSGLSVNAINSKKYSVMFTYEYMIGTSEDSKKYTGVFYNDFQPNIVYVPSKDYIDGYVKKYNDQLVTIYYHKNDPSKNALKPHKNNAKLFFAITGVLTVVAIFMFFMRGKLNAKINDTDYVNNKYNKVNDRIVL